MQSKIIKIVYDTYDSLLGCKICIRLGNGRVLRSMQIPAFVRKGRPEAQPCPMPTPVLTVDKFPCLGLTRES